MSRTRHIVADGCKSGADSVPRLVLAVTLPNSHGRIDAGTPSHQSFNQERQGLASKRIHHARFERYTDHATTLQTPPFPV